MDAITEKLSKYGVNIKNVMERFVDDIDLYKDCLCQFVEDACFEELRISIENNDYVSAFENAHTLKGVSGNLGLTPLFNSICIIVEALRKGSYDNLNKEYDEIIMQLDMVKKIISDDI